LVSIISSEGPDTFGFKPTPEANFAITDYFFVGTVFNGATSDFRQFNRDGDVYTFVTELFNPVLNPIAVDPIRSLIPVQIPRTSRVAIVHQRFNIQGTAAGLVFLSTRAFLPGAASPSRNLNFQSVATGALENFVVEYESMLPADSAGDIEVNTTGAVNVTGASLTYSTIGYVEQGRP
jgi:hypothetical protein